MNTLMHISGLRILTFMLMVCASAAILQAAPVGVTISNAVTTVPEPYLLETDAAHDTLKVRIAMRLQRAGAAPAANVTVRYLVRLTPTGAGASVASQSFTRVFNIPGGYDQIVNEDIEVDPAIVLTDITTHDIQGQVFHIEDPAVPVLTLDDSDSTTVRLAHCNGTLKFGSVAATLQSFGALPQFLYNPSTWRVRVGAGMTPTGYGFTQGSTLWLDVTRDALGALTVISGDAVVPAAPSIPWLGWTLERGTVRLTKDGIFADNLTFVMPAGIGYRVGQTTLLADRFPAAAAPIAIQETNLAPAAPFGGAAIAGAEIVADALPVAFGIASWSFNLGTLTFSKPSARFLRKDRYDQYAALSGDPPDSNDGFWRQLKPGTESDLALTPRVTGGVSVSVAFASGKFSTHFPLAHAAHSGGTASVEDSRFNPNVSTLTSPQIDVIYSRNCAPCPGDPWPDAGDLEEIGFSAALVRFTPSGGLHATGPTVPASVRIGKAAGGPAAVHQLDPIDTANFLAPGAITPPEDGFDSATDSNDQVDESGEAPAVFNPARYLLAGVSPQKFEPELPGTPAYATGAGDYAGLNFRYRPGLAAESRIGGSPLPVPYTVASNWKGYLRQSGFSGIHEADPASVPPGIFAYGYTITLDSLGWSYLSNAPVASRTAGDLDLPYPSDFAIELERIGLNCCGNPTSFTLSDDSVERNLAYWSNTALTLQSGRFSLGAGCGGQCNPDNGLLELGVEAPVGGLPGVYAGFLYPDPAGALSTGNEPLGRESRLLAGPTTLRGFGLIPTRHVYFNDHTQHPSLATPGPGFQNVAGLLNVPFFRDLPIHAHTSGPGDAPESVIQMQGGWTAASDTFFNNAGFDAAHRGFPAQAGVVEELELQTYRTSEAFRTHAVRDWFGGAFDFPVRFDDVVGSFTSSAPAVTDLRLSDLESNVDFLTTKTADISFGTSFALLPKLTLANVAGAVLDNFTPALAQQLEARLTNIEQAADLMIATLDTRATAFLDANLAPAMNFAVASPLVAIIRALPQPCTEAQVALVVSNYLDPLGAITTGLNAAAGGAGSLPEITPMLDKMADDLRTLRTNIIDFRDNYLDEDNLRDAVMAAMSGFPDTSVDPDMVQETMAEIVGTGPVDGALHQLRQRADEIIAVLDDLIDTLEQGGPWADELLGTIAGIPAELADVIGVLNAMQETGLKRDIKNYLYLTLCQDPAGYSDAELTAQITAMLTDGIRSVISSGALQTAVRNNLYHLFESTKHLLQSGLELLNGAIRTAFSAIGFLPGLALAPVRGFGQHFLTGGLHGQAHTEGDDLRTLRLDGNMALNLATQTEAKSWFEYRHLTAEGFPLCGVEPGDRVHEILVGASLAQAKFLRSMRKVTIDGRFTLQENGDPLGMAGSFELASGGFKFGALTALNFNANMAIGGGNGYLAAGISAQMPAVPGAMSFSGGAFFGRTCEDLDAMPWLPQDGFVPADPPFTGIITYVEGATNIFGRTCLARLRAGAGAGCYMLVDESDMAAVWGGRFKGWISGEIICLLNAKGEIVLDGRARGEAFEFDGRATLSTRKFFGGVRKHSLEVHYHPGDGFSYKR